MQPRYFREFNELLHMAPGEHISPIRVFKDINSEFLAFPTIYSGKTRPDKKDKIIRFHYSSLCRWELKNVDRRCFPNIFFKMNIFFSIKKLQIKQTQDIVSLAITKMQIKREKYSVAKILNSILIQSYV